MNNADQLTDADLLEMYVCLVRIRAFEDRVAELWANGTLAELPHGSQGQEAIAVGACYGLRPDDKVLASLRTRGVFFVRGISSKIQMAGMHGRATGPAHGKATAHHMADRERGLLLGSGIVGASITVAVGAALAARLQSRDSVVVDFFGDGASQRGDFHEALNLAGVMKLPVVFVLENNGMAEHTPVSKHFAGTDFACRAEGYGFPGYRIDGNDVLAVYDAVQTAAARARAGEGPTLLDCVTYRLRGHSEINAPTELRDPAEIEQWRAKDPIPRFRTLLAERGILTATRVAEIDAAATAEMDEAVAYAQSSPLPDLSEIVAGVYAPENPELVGGRRS
jgi:TPP-dependent pyruvate/acetoin dehydrogenase alpha subunit